MNGTASQEMAGDGATESRNSALGIRLGSLPPPVVDAMFVALVSEAERFHGPSVRAAVAASFASARVEAEIMGDPDINPRERLKAAQQLRDGFAEACRLVSGASRRSSPMTGGAPPAPGVPTALEELYGRPEEG